MQVWHVPESSKGVGVSPKTTPFPSRHGGVTRTVIAQSFARNEQHGHAEDGESVAPDKSNPIVG